MNRILFLIILSISAIESKSQNHKSDSLAKLNNYYQSQRYIDSILSVSDNKEEAWEDSFSKPKNYFQTQKYIDSLTAISNNLENKQEAIEDSFQLSKGIPYDYLNDHTPKAQQYKTYLDKSLGISFEIPIEWQVKDDGEGQIYTWNLKYKREEFRIEIRQVLFNSDFIIGLDKKNGIYFTGEYNQSESGKRTYYNKQYAYPLKGINWKGYWYLGICQLANPECDKITCECIYFNNTKKNTVIIRTCGKEIPARIKKKIITSFRFL